jgi:hypothetical protein
MAERVPFLLRLDPEVLAALRKWAGDDLRSLNAEIEYLLRSSLQRASRMPDGRADGRVDEDESRPSASAEGNRG